jgi:galactokinase
MDYQYFPLVLDGYQIILFDTGIKHALASSEYNTRRKECEQGVELIKAKYPNVKSLRDASIDMLDGSVDIKKYPTIYNRCKYVIEEIARTQNACLDLQANNLEAFGQKMFATHQGLSKLYEVSCPELDFLVEQVKDDPAVIGARMMGGGFGGCTINIIQSENAPQIINEIKTAYQLSTGKDLKHYIMRIEDGAGTLS